MIARTVFQDTIRPMTGRMVVDKSLYQPEFYIAACMSGEWPIDAPEVLPAGGFVTDDMMMSHTSFLRSWVLRNE